MAQSNFSHMSRQDSDERRQGASRQIPAMLQSTSAPQRLRTEAESWVEISSQPSSSSLSSIGDEVVTTGLRVQRSNRRRRRSFASQRRDFTQAQHAGTSSQDEYEETESEEDHVMTSSTEQIHAPAFASSMAQPAQTYDSDSDDDDENATALGRVPDEPIFTPQPNAFSHPPISQMQRRQSATETYHSRPAYNTHSRSYSGRTRSHTPYNAISPSYRADNDAALRASLTTLLSCAAAARGLPKQTQEAYQPSQAARNEPTSLRLVPESEVMGNMPTPEPRSKTPATRSVGTRSAANSDTETSKKKTTSRASSVQGKTSKKKKATTAQDALISPTLLTWLVSAGVVVIFSVVGFGAGYALGKEAGRQETLAGFSSQNLSDSASCGKEVVKGSSGLRRIPWRAGVSKAIKA